MKSISVISRSLLVPLYRRQTFFSSVSHVGLIEKKLFALDQLTKTPEADSNSYNTIKSEINLSYILRAFDDAIEKNDKELVKKIIDKFDTIDKHFSKDLNELFISGRNILRNIANKLFPRPTLHSNYVIYDIFSIRILIRWAALEAAHHLDYQFLVDKYWVTDRRHSYEVHAVMLNAPGSISDKIKAIFAYLRMHGTQSSLVMTDTHGNNYLHCLFKQDNSPWYITPERFLEIVPEDDYHTLGYTPEYCFLYQKNKDEKTALDILLDSGSPYAKEILEKFLNSKYTLTPNSVILVEKHLEELSETRVCSLNNTA